MAVPSATSCSPTITATRAPERPAAFICDFIDRPSKARSVREPGQAQLVRRGRGRSAPSVASTTNTSSVEAGAANTPSASQASSMRSMPEPNPMPGVGGPPSCSTRPS